MARAKKQDSTVRFKVGEDAYEIDAEALSLGETAEAEAEFDAEFDDLHGSQKTIALLYLAMKRRKPSTSWESVKMLEWRNIEVGDSARPTQADPAPAGTQAS